MWLKNRMATRALDGLMPYQAVFGCAPDVSRLHWWGATVWVHVGNGDKFAACAHEGRWLGFDTELCAHCIYFPSSCSVVTECNVYFGAAPQLKGEKLDIPGTESEQCAALPTPTTLSPLHSTSTSLPPALPPTQVHLLPLPTITLPSPLSSRSSSPSPPPAVTCVVPNLQERPTRNRKPAPVLHDLLKGVTTSSSWHSDLHFLVGTQLPGGFGEETKEAGGAWSAKNAFTVLKDLEWLEYILVAEIAAAEALEPSTLAEAKHHPDWSLWEKAIEEELATLKATGTWQLEEAPPRANVIGSKWVFKVKKDAARNIAQYKACLIAQGFSQIGGIDYDDTYAPMAKLASLHASIAMANCLHLILHQINIKGAYLNGTLKDDKVLYLRHPPGYRAPNAGKQVLQLLKVLYGLKQVGHRWYQMFTEILVKLGFTQCSVDQAVYHKSNALACKLMVIAVHVDDCTIAVSERRLVDDFKARLSKHVKVTDLGELHWMLGIEVKCNWEAGTVHLSQCLYIDSILHRFNFADLKPLSTPMDVQAKLISEQVPATAAKFVAMWNIPYHEAVSALNWAALTTHPNILFAVSTVTRFTSNPSPAHWEAVKQIFCYLARTRDLWLSYGKVCRTLVGYTDADGSMAEDCHAISGYVFLIDGGAVSWSSKWQEIVSLSTTESEYVMVTHRLKEAMWLCSLLSEVFSSFKDTTVLLCDNQSVIALACGHQYHACTKHIDVCYHFI
jgi:hypothetical protein